MDERLQRLERVCDARVTEWLQSRSEYCVDTIQQSDLTEYKDKIEYIQSNPIIVDLQLLKMDNIAPEQVHLSAQEKAKQDISQLLSQLMDLTHEYSRLLAILAD